MRQAEVESSQSHLESVQNDNTELHFQLRASSERLNLLAEQLEELRRRQDYKPQPQPIETKTSRGNSDVEAKLEVKLVELQTKLTSLEKDNLDTEALYKRSLSQKVQEIETLKAEVEALRAADEQSKKEITSFLSEKERIVRDSTHFQSQAKGLEQQNRTLLDIQVNFFCSLVNISLTSSGRGRFK